VNHTALKNYAGGPAQKVSNVPSELSIGDILIENMKRLGVDLLRAPFRSKEKPGHQSVHQRIFKNGFAGFEQSWCH